jgi:CRISPR/Cas system Type II protein with McrA/HNH and RuvC-like nuclease domain
MTNELAVIFWEKEFGDKVEAVDFVGRRIFKSEHESVNPNDGWNIDHILPKEKYGADSDENKQIVHIKTNKEKGVRVTFKIDGREFQVKKTKNAGKGIPTGYDYSKKKYCVEEVIDENDGSFVRKLSARKREILFGDDSDEE